MFTWKILELFANGQELESVKYNLSATDGKNTIHTEGYHVFLKGFIKKTLAEIKESDLIGWLETDTTKDDVNAIKLNLETQLKNLEKEQKIDFPWLVDTFTVE
jgi:hypothetical protein